MPANVNPIYTVTPDVSKDNSTGMGALITAAAADYTGASVNYVLVHTSGTNGSYVRRLRFKAGGTNVVAVMRVFINNGSVNTTATNNEFYDEISLPATTASTTAATATIDLPMDVQLRNGQRIYVGLGAAVAAGWSCVAIAGQY